MMRCLKYVSLLLLIAFASCGNPYKKLQPSGREVASAMRFKPVVAKEVYRCIVDGKVLHLKKFHLSGLLIFKTFDDGSTRAVFQNEMGFTFFDFKWNDKDSFEVVSVIPQLDKPAVLKLLQKDMDLVLMKRLNATTEMTFAMGDETYQRFTLDKGVAYYISQNGRLRRIENAGNGKVITIDMKDKATDHQLPEGMFFRHHKANFTIDLKRINSSDDE